MIQSFGRTPILGTPSDKRLRKNMFARQLCARAALETLEPRTLLSTVNLSVTTLADSGAGSLRAAVATANNSNPDDIVNIDLTNLSGTITLASQLGLGATSITTITGPGPTLLSISGNNASRVFQIDAGVIATFSGLTITGGLAPANTGGGGIFNLGNLTLTNITVSGNTANYGGGIYHNNGSLTLNDCTLAGNTAIPGNSPHSYVDGGGGGLFSGDFSVEPSSTPSVTIHNSTISGNTAAGGGGGILTIGRTMTLTNSTVAANTLNDDFYGGGIFSSFGNLTLTNCTVAYNSADVGAGVLAANLTLNNSIVAQNNTPKGNPPSDIEGPAKGAHNLVGSLTTSVTGTVGNVTNGINGNLVGIANPLLGPLQNNGGPTQTIAPQNGSPAIGAGSVDLIPSGVTTDQTGALRIFNGTVNIGAVEFITSHQKFVATIYRDLLNRYADPAGLQFWTGLLDAGTHTLSDIATSITSSREYDGIVVDAFYFQYLGRHSEFAGLNTWVNQMQAGLNAEVIRAGILGSDEYYNLQGGTDSAYITVLYHNFLHRDTDANGLQVWIGQLDHSSPAAATNARIVVSSSISASNESRTTIVTGFYQTYLHRNPNDPGLQIWITNLANGITQPQIISFFVTTAEYLSFNHIT